MSFVLLTIAHLECTTSLKPTVEPSESCNGHQRPQVVHRSSVTAVAVSETTAVSATAVHEDVHLSLQHFRVQ